MSAYIYGERDLFPLDVAHKRRAQHFQPLFQTCIGVAISCSAYIMSISKFIIHLNIPNARQPENQIYTSDHMRKSPEIKKNLNLCGGILFPVVKLGQEKRHRKGESRIRGLGPTRWNSHQAKYFATSKKRYFRRSKRERKSDVCRGLFLMYFPPLT